VKLNKKIIYNILTIGMLVCVAITGTWGYFQDTVTSKSNRLEIGSIDLWVDYTEATPNGQAIVSGNQITNIIPDKAVKNGVVPQHLIKTIQIQNFGTVKGKLYVQMKPTIDTLGSGSGVVVRLYDGGLPGIIYSNGINYAPVTLNPVPVTDISPEGVMVPLSLMYSFSDTNVNQNQYENKELKFDLIFTLKPSQ
jgi:predicted ribosomally synthesized peptide with SipW-like signal peptide